MASDGSHGPRPWTQRQARTIFLRVPRDDWVEVSRGLKREFRASPKACSQTFSIEPPTPVVAYTITTQGHDRKLMVLERKWDEPLGAISKESLEAEGYASMADFRQYWMRREHRRFQPLRMVTCFRLRPWLPGEDDYEMGIALFERLYGEFREAG